MIEDAARCYRAVESRDARFDGWFVAAVTSTGIYCRPSCPARTSKRENVRFYPGAAAAQTAGFRACRRCRPDASPGSPEWNQRADVVGRAMRLIADGVVDREGVAGVARRLAHSEHHLKRLLTAELGAGPLALARALRAETARTLIETTQIGLADVAFAAGFASVRRFNETVREVFAATPTELRRHRPASAPSAPGSICVRLPARLPFDGPGLIAFLGARAVPGVEAVVEGAFRRTLRLPHGAGVAELQPGESWVRCSLWLDDLRDLTAAVQRCRRLFDLDADPAAVVEHLSGDALIGHAVRRGPGRRLPGTVDGAELAMRAVLGQQVSVAGARTLAARLVRSLGEPLSSPRGELTHLFPTPAVIASAGSAVLRMPAARRAAVLRLAGALAAGDVALDAGVDRGEVERSLLALPGIGPWTVSYVAIRALGDPDAFLPTDLGVRRAFERLGRPGDPRTVTALAEAWRPWRAYALQYLWGLDAEPVAARTA